MRTIRSLAAVCSVALLPLLPKAASAQSERLFRDSWFWGAKVGLTTFSTNTSSNVVAPAMGAEWLITRTRFGLNLAIDQSFFNETATIGDQDGTRHTVDLKDLRRVSAQAFFFPGSFLYLRPYAGLGFALNMIHQAKLRDDFTDPSQYYYVADRLHELKDRASFIMTAGTQLQMNRLAPFGQLSYQPSHVGFILNQRPTYLLEAGLRINFGSAIEHF